MTSVLSEDILEEILNTGKEEVQLTALMGEHTDESTWEKPSTPSASMSR